MDKFTLILNSHALTDFQHCEMKHLLRDVVSIIPTERKRAFEKGSLISRLLANYYYRKMKGKNPYAKILNPMITWPLAEKLLGFSREDAKQFAYVLVEYHNQYKNCQWIPLAVEKGFSKVLYEDNDNLFIYEGKPDLIAKVGQDIIGIDHKHQSKMYNIFEHNNQALGYAWALDLKYFVYNYIKFTKEDKFRRPTYQFSSEQLQQWINDTTEWFFRIKRSLTHRNFCRNWSACQDKYGLCDYTQICTQPNSNVKDWIIKSKFKQVKKYRSW
jgi:hypothetical protein